MLLTINDGCEPCTVHTMVLLSSGRESQDQFNTHTTYMYGQSLLLLLNHFAPSRYRPIHSHTQTNTHHRVKTLSISGSIHFIIRWNNKHVKRNHGDVKNYHFLLPWEHVSDDQWQCVSVVYSRVCETINNHICTSVCPLVTTTNHRPMVLSNKTVNIATRFIFNQKCMCF